MGAAGPAGADQAGGAAAASGDSEPGAAPVAEQDEPGAPPPEQPQHLVDEFLKDHGAARRRLNERGYEALAVYTADYFSNRRGGIERGSVFLGNLDLLFTLDAETAFGWTGTTFFVYILGTHGGDPSDLVGDAQGLDNIAAPSTIKLYELLGEVRLAPQFSLLAGLYDVNSEFDVIDTSQDFINSSFGIGPDFSQSGRNGPSIFPITSLGLRAKIQPSMRFYLQAAALDGVSGDPDDPKGTRISINDNEGALFVGEGGWLLEPADDHPPEARRLRARRIGRQQDWR
jgi:porin